MSNKSNAFEYCLYGISGVYSLANIEELLGILILSAQLLLIVLKIFSKITHRKNKRGGDDNESEE